MLKIDHKNYTIYAPNQFAKDWLQERYTLFIQKCIQTIHTKMENLDFDYY